MPRWAVSKRCEPIELQGVYGRELLPSWRHRLDRLSCRLLLPGGIVWDRELPDGEILVGIGRRLHQLPGREIPGRRDRCKLQGVSRRVLLPCRFHDLQSVPLRVLLSGRGGINQGLPHRLLLHWK